MRGERWLLRTGEFLVGRAARRLPAAARDERYQEWAAELPVILHDRDVRPAAARAARMLWFAADTLRGATLRGAGLRPGPAGYRGAHRGGMGQGGAVKTARWLGVGAGLLLALAALLALQAFVIYEEIMVVTSLAGYVTYLLTNLALLAVIRLSRLDRAYFWAGAGVTAAAAGGGAAHLAGHLGWGHPLLFTLISAGGYAACAVCLSMPVATMNRSARRDRQA